MKKRVLYVVVCLMLVLSGCGNTETQTSSEKVTQATEIITTQAVATETKTETKTKEELKTESKPKTSRKKLADSIAKSTDVINAAKIHTAFYAALADPDAFDEFAPMRESGGFVIQPFEDGSYEYIFPDGKDAPKVKEIMDEKLKGTDIYFNYFASNWEPVIWCVNVDNDFKPYVCIYTKSDELVELAPNIDKKYD